MPIISAPAKILVTGASGFLAVHIVKALIEGGYFVRGTVRSDRKGQYLKNLFGGEKFEYVLVEDMEVPNAYDEAVQGVDAVEHTAGITNFKDGHPDLIIKPAVNGTVGILDSVKKFGHQVKRVVITSATPAINGPDETYWNDASVEAVKRDGINTHPRVKYWASKTLAERAAWQFMEDNKGKINFDLTTLCPPWIWGPLLHEGNDTSSINLSTGYLLAGLDINNPKKGAELVTQDSAGYVDVRDVAAIHVDMLSAEGAGNNRFLADAGWWNWQDVYDALNEAPAIENVPKGEIDAARTVQAEKPRSQKLLVMLGRTQSQVFRPFNVTIRDTVADVRDNRGWTTGVGA